MQMSEQEIVRDYLESKNKGKQVGILAELNACSKDKIIEILKAGGVDSRQLPRTRGPKLKKAEVKGKVEKKEPELLEEKKEEPVMSFPVAGTVKKKETTDSEPEVQEDDTYITAQRNEQFQIPETVRKLCNEKLYRLEKEIMELEKEHDEIAEFLSGVSADE